MPVDDHLGGFVKGGDEATYFPRLWKFLVSDGITSMLDVGCGEGHAMQFFRDQGIEAFGVDGVKQKDISIREHDFTEGPFVWRPVDLIWSCEFVEHVEEQYASNLVRTFKSAKLVLMTHAFPGQAGHHHVNCRDSEYWKGFMTAAGFLFNPQYTELTRSLTLDNPSEYNHYLRSGMAFDRKPVA